MILIFRTANRDINNLKVSMSKIKISIIKNAKRQEL